MWEKGFLAETDIIHQISNNFKLEWLVGEKTQIVKFVGNLMYFNFVHLRKVDCSRTISKKPTKNIRFYLLMHVFNVASRNFAGDCQQSPVSDSAPRKTYNIDEIKTTSTVSRFLNTNRLYYKYYKLPTPLLDPRAATDTNYLIVQSQDGISLNGRKYLFLYTH